MPGGDRTGPIGAGPMTGRAAGFCAGYPVPGYMNSMPGRGFGFGFGRGQGRGWFGRGRGWRHRYWATGFPGRERAGFAYPASGVYPPDLTPNQEMDMLKQEAKTLKTQLDDIQNRIETLEKIQKTGKSDK